MSDSGNTQGRKFVNRIAGYTTIFAAVLILGLFLSFYLWYYVSRNEQKIYNRNFRALDRIAYNMSQRIPDFCNLAQVKVKSAEDKIDQKASVWNYNLFKEENKEIFDLYRISGNLLPKGIENSGEKMVLIPDEPGTQVFSDSTYVNATNGETYLIFRFRVTKPKIGAVELGIRISRYLPRLLKYDYFTGYAFLKNKKVVFNQLGPIFDKNSADSLLNHVSGLRTRSIKNIEITGTESTLFTIPVSLFDNDSYLLCGMIPTKKVKAEKMYVPDSYVFALLFLLLGVAAMFPFLKIFLMSQYEKLKSFDLLLAMFSLTLGSGVFFYVMFSQYNYRVVDKKAYADLQEKLADSISQSFLNDVSAAQDQLMEFDSKVSKFQHDLADIFRSPHDPVTKQNYFSVWKENNVRKLYEEFKLAFWLNKDGVDSIRWVNDAFVPHHNNYSDRPYFKNVVNNALWRWPDNKRPPFTIQPIRSWTDGEFRAVIAQKSRSDQYMCGKGKYDLKAAAISARLPSVLSAILPFGYNFCIVDQRGEVWFHSDPDRNLNENIIEECNGNEQLRTALETRTETTISEHYSGYQAQVFSKPVKGFPLNVIIIMDKAPLTMKNINVFFMSLFFLISILLLIGIQIALLLCFNIRNSKMKANKMRLDYFWPDRRKTKVYNKFIRLNLALFGATLFWLWCPVVEKNPILVYFICFLNCYISLTTYYAVCNTKYFKVISETNRLWMFRIYAIVIPILAFILFLCKSDITTNITGFTFMTGAFILVRILFNKEIMGKNGNDPCDEDSIVMNRKMVNGFSGMLVTWVLIASFLPVYVFCPLAIDFESLVISKQHQVAWVNEINKLTNFSPELFSEPKRIHIHGKDSVRTVYNMQGIYQTEITERRPSQIKKNETGGFGEKDIADLNIIPLLGSGRVASQGHMYSKLGNEDSVMFQWGWKDRNQLVLESIDGILSKGEVGDRLILNTTLPRYKLPGRNGEKSAAEPVLFYIVFALIIAGLFFLCNYFIRKVFLPDYLDTKNSNQKKLLDGLAIITQEELSVRKEGIKLLMVGLPHSGKSIYLKSQFEQFNKKYIDFANIQDEALWKVELAQITYPTLNDLVICFHFEYELSNPVVNKKKFKFIERLYRKGIKNIIIISTIHPSTFLNHVSKFDDETKGMTTDITALIKDDNYYIWSALLNSFEVVYYPLERDKSRFHEDDLSYEAVLANEFNHGLFLRQMKHNHQLILRHGSNNLSIEEAEEIYLRIQTLAYNYYLSLWNSLQREEQYVLFDLAEDGLVNYKNFETLSRLYHKGIILNSGRLSIMNRSFRNFILTEVKKGNPVSDDVVRSRDSAWKKFRVPFYIIFLVVMFFIFYTQQESFNMLTTILGSFTASLPLILNLWNSLSAGKMEKSQ